jgi:acyl dehydratase
MPLTPEQVGREVGRIRVTPDARWLMAYAAGVPDARPELYDTTAALVTHPMFPVAPEWELIMTHRTSSATMTRAEVLSGVHSAHDVIVERSIVPGETLDLVATVAAVDRRRSGCTQDLAFVATDATGAIVWRTRFTSFFRGVELVGEPTSAGLDWPERPAAVPGGAPVAERDSHVRAVDAHVYTECARIWNPIHTDLAVARSAGLPAPILHGTATLARGVSIATELAGWQLADVGRVAAGFTAMVDLDTTITVRLLDVSPSTLRFDVVTHDGRPAVTEGLIARGTNR